MRRDWPGSRWILRFLVNGGDPPPREETQKEEQAGGELAEACGPLTSDALSFPPQLEMLNRQSIRGSGAQVRGTLEGKEVQRPKKGKVIQKSPPQ